MDEKKAREILKDWIVENDNLYHLGAYIWWTSGEVQLDGDFTADQLEAIAWWIRNKRIGKL